MARPHKQGIDYFSLDTVLDDKFELFEAEYGLQGFGFIIKLFQKIYEANGYYYKWTDDEKLLFSKRVNVDINLINDYINSAIKREIFNQNVYEKYQVLTSKGVQKRFLEASKRRKRIEIIKEFFLLDMTSNPEYSDLISKVVYVSNNEENVNTNVENDNDNSQRKRKEREKETEIIKKQFEHFWKLYPRKVKKQKAKEWFEKNKPTEELFVIMITALKKFINSQEWKSNNGQFIPHPTTWLNQRRWEDLSGEGGDLCGIDEKRNSQYDEAKGTTL